MRSSQLLSAVAFAAGATAIQNLLQIPQVAHDVRSMLDEFQKYTNYRGPTGTAASAIITARPEAELAVAATSCTSYWLEDIAHQGTSAFNADPAGYQVFRNVKDFGAKGDGVTDDTAAINAAMSSGGRCAPGSCASSTTTPAIVYFPSGVYTVSSSLIDFYYTQLIGNPNCPPTLQAIAGFTGFGVIDGDPYQSSGKLGYGSTNVFFRQIKNFVIDLTLIPPSASALGVHWPTAQATSIQNVVFHMSDAPGTQHQAIFIEEGSGGFMNDLTFYGGLNGVAFGNQQFTMRNLTFYNAQTAITQIWDWGWTYKSIAIYNCSVGLNMSAGGTGAQSVGSITFVDSSMTDVGIGIATAFDSTSQPPSAGSLIIDNLDLDNVPIAVQGPAGATVLEGTTGAITITGWGEGHKYTPNGPTEFQGPITPISRPATLVSGGKYYERSKPLYGDITLAQIASARAAGAKGDGTTDDTAALQDFINAAAAAGKVAFVDAGAYKLTNTLAIPAGSKIVGEAYSILLSSGPYFNDATNPKPVVQVGVAGDTGLIEWSDMIVSTQGQQEGAILVEWNLASPASTPSGMWDVHARIGGFAGSNLQLAQCPTTPSTTTPPAPVASDCIAAYLTMHITTSASGLYLENVWLWTADHDIEDNTNTQVTIYTGRGLYDESSTGIVWLVGTAVEHHSLYQYQFANTKDVFMGQIQTETAYYQPNPDAKTPFSPVDSINDPDFATYCAGQTGNCDGWGLRVLSSSGLRVYGAGLYSFFDNYSTNCSAVGNGEACQANIFSLDATSDIEVYNLNSVGTTNMITRDGTSLASYADNINAFPDTITLFTSS